MTDAPRPTITLSPGFPKRPRRAIQTLLTEMLGEDGYDIREPPEGFTTENSPHLIPKGLT